jgi:hypothetical protein
VLTDRIDQRDITNICRVYLSAVAQYTVPSATQGTFSKIDHTLGHKETPSKYKNIEIIPCIVSDHNGIKSGLNSRKNNIQYLNTWILSNTLKNDQ